MNPGSSPRQLVPIGMYQICRMGLRAPFYFGVAETDECVPHCDVEPTDLIYYTSCWKAKGPTITGEGFNLIEEGEDVQLILRALQWQYNEKLGRLCADGIFIKGPA